MNDSEIGLEVYQKADADTKVAMVKDYIAKGTKNCEWLVKWSETKSTGAEYSLTVKDGELTRQLIQKCSVYKLRPPKLSKLNQESKEEELS